MKRLLALMLSLLICLTFLSACGNSGDDAVVDNSEPPAQSQDTQGEGEQSAEESTEPDFENWNYITTSGVFDEDVVFKFVPDGYNTYATEHAGTTEVIRYTTDVYEDGVTYEKFARVYLPYGYDPADTETKYNVIYFQHGNGSSPNALFDHDMKTLHPLNIINNIFDPDHQVMEPCIIVCPTYYLEYDETAYVTPGDNAAGDGRYEGIPGNYYMEVIEDLIPAVESQYNVYCTDFSKEGIIDSRDHRAWIGYSRGSICTFYMFHNTFEYFAYWMPMSAPCIPEETLLENGFDWSVEEAFNYIKEPIVANPDLDFFLLGTAGGDKDKFGAIELGGLMQEQMVYFAQQTDVFSFGTDPVENNLYFARSDLAHTDLYAPYSLPNAADIFFK